MEKQKTRMEKKHAAAISSLWQSESVSIGRLVRDPLPLSDSPRHSLGKSVHLNRADRKALFRFRPVANCRLNKSVALHSIQQKSMLKACEKCYATVFAPFMLQMRHHTTDNISFALVNTN